MSAAARIRIHPGEQAAWLTRDDYLRLSAERAAREWDTERVIDYPRVRRRGQVWRIRARRAAAADAAADAARAAKDAAEDAARAAEQAYDAARGSTDRVWGELQKFFDRSLQAARALADEASAIQSLTGDRKRSLRGEMADTRALAAAQGRAYIDDALRQTLTGGALPSSDKLGQAIDAAVAGLDVNQYASVAQYEVDKAILAAKLGALEEGAGLRLTDAEQQIGLLEQQVQHYQQLIDVQRGMQTTVTSIDDGIAQLVGLLAAETAAQAKATLTADAAADLAKIAQAIANLLVLLGDDTQAGSIRAIVGPSGATAGTTSLRALRQQSNTAVINAASIKALIGLTINLAQLVIDDAQATRKVARQTLRLARLATGDHSSADVGADV